MSDNESIDFNNPSIDDSDEEFDGDQLDIEENPDESGPEDLRSESEDSSDEKSIMPDISLDFGQSDETKEDQNEDDKDSDEEEDNNGGEQQYSERK